MGFKSFMIREAENKTSALSIASRAVGILSSITGKEIKYFGSGAAIIGSNKNMYMSFVIDKKKTFVVMLSNDSIKGVAIYDSLKLEPNDKPEYYIETVNIKLTEFLKTCRVLIEGILDGKYGGKEFEFVFDANEPEQTSEAVFLEANIEKIIDGIEFATKLDAAKYLLKKGMGVTEVSRKLGIPQPQVFKLKKDSASVVLQTAKVKTKSAPKIKAVNTPSEQAFENRSSGEKDVEIVYKMMGLYIDSILNKKTYGLIISGSPGVGKSDMLEKKIKAKGLKPLEARKVPEKKVITDPKTKEKTEIDVARTEYVGDYTLIKGKITTSSFYEEICRNRHGLIVFDDCDSMFESSDGENLMKALLDSKKIREVSYYSKSAVMSNGDNDEEIMKILEDGKVPKKVVFDGQFVAITNLPLAKLDSAILSRVDKVSLNFNGPEIFKKIKITVESSKEGLRSEIPKNVQNVIVDYFDEKFLVNPKWKPGSEEFNYRTFNNACYFYMNYGNDSDWRTMLDVALK